MSQETYTRAKLGDGRWDINHPERVDSTGQLYLRKEVKIALPGKSFDLNCDGTEAVFEFEDTLTQGERDTLDQVVANHKANVITSEALAVLKAAKQTSLKVEVDAFVEAAGYTKERRDTFSAELTLSAQEGLTNRYNYIKAGWAWAKKVRAHYYECYGQVAVATTKAEVEAVAINLTQFEPGQEPNGDPQVTLYGMDQVTES